MKQKSLANVLGRVLQRLFIAALVTGLALGAGTTLAAHAATITVTTTADSGPGSLRQGMACAPQPAATARYALPSRKPTPWLATTSLSSRPAPTS